MVRLPGMRSGGRVVEGARLESEYTAKPYRGFESLPLRQRYPGAPTGVGRINSGKWGINRGLLAETEAVELRRRYCRSEGRVPTELTPAEADQSVLPPMSFRPIRAITVRWISAG